MEKKEKKANFPNISLKKFETNPGTPEEITNWYWGWWEGLIPTGTYSCYLEKNGLKCWRPDNCVLISDKTEKISLDNNGKNGSL